MNEVLYAARTPGGGVGRESRWSSQLRYINLLYLTITKINYKLSTNIISKASNLEYRKKSSRVGLKREIATHMQQF